jgi:RHS repeat-associated protein
MAGNLVKIADSSYSDIKYYYDQYNRLIREDNPIYGTWTYAYDDRGNITSKVEYAYTTGTLGTPLSTKSYVYNGAWEDLLTSYNGLNIEYDATGNPTKYKSATTNMTWQGRQLMVYGTNTFLYDASGLRVQKNGIYYTYHNGQLSSMHDGTSYYYFVYDMTGLSCMVTYDGSNYNYYYYLKNVMGDVVEMINSAGTMLAKYTYDAWGRCKVYNPDGTLNTNAAFIGNVNPFRYRSYYYDRETSLYYLQSRYYDPETGRFINADSARILGIGMNVLGGTNLFSYCLNNPIMDIDPSGEFSKEIEDALFYVAIGALLIAGAAIVIGTGGFGLVGVSAVLVATSTTALNASLIVAALAFGGYAFSKCDFDDDNYSNRERVGRSNGNSPRNNRAQNEQAKEVARRLRLTPDEINRMHRNMPKGLGFGELLEWAKEFFNK